MQSSFRWLGFPIRKSADQFIFADPRSLSQLITSFIASESQGIPRVPFLTFFYHCRLLLGTVCFFELKAKSPKLKAFAFLLSTLGFLPFCCLLFQFTSSNMSKNVLLRRWRIKEQGWMTEVFFPFSFIFLLSSIVENNGFEPLTPCVQGRCSSQLS